MLRSFSTTSPFRSLLPNLFSAKGVNNVLGKVTLIYGQNGAGKTSFSELLRNGRDPAKVDYCSVTASLRVDEQNIRIGLDDSDFPLDFAVYNRYYVEDSLKLFLDGEGKSEPIPVLHIGASNVETEERIRSLQALKTEREKWLEAASGSAEHALAGIKQTEEAIKDIIIAALKPGDPETYNSTRYRITKVRKLLESSENITKLSEDALEKALQVACEATKQPAHIPGAFPQPSRVLREQSTSALLRSVKSTIIPELANDPSRSNWVEDGLKLHTPGDTCMFCQEGVVREALIDAYEQHFSKALRDLRADLNRLTREVKAENDAIENWFAELPGKSELLYEFEEAYEEHLNALLAEWGAYQQRSNRLLDLLAKRLSDPLVPLEREEVSGVSHTILESEPLLDVLRRNEEACDNQVKGKQDAQQKVEAHYASDRQTEYAELASSKAQAERAVSALQRSMARLEQEHAQLRSSQHDTGPMALQIDSDLRNHFGHGHLRILQSEDRTGYIVMRGTELATDLSEGERNAIAFLYFLASLEADDVDKSRTVVVVDDPVTSLDRESLFAAFGVQNTYLAEFAQTIFLTHDYEFFRLQMGHLESKFRKSRKRIDEGEESEIAYPGVSVLEIKPALNVEGQRVSYLRPLAQELLLHSSEYHYLFHKILSAVQRDADDEYPLLGNAARRLIEGFVAFQAPHVNNFTGRANWIAQQRGVEESLVRRVVKFMHGQSHRENPNPTTGLDFPSIQGELIAVIKFMRETDKNHFTNMCKAVKIIEQELIFADELR